MGNAACCGESNEQVPAYMQGVSAQKKSKKKLSYRAQSIKSSRNPVPAILQATKVTSLSQSDHFRLGQATLEKFMTRYKENKMVHNTKGGLYESYYCSK